MDSDTVWPYKLQGSSTLLVGGVGGGKTHCLRTYLDAGIEVFGIFTEPRGPETLADTDPDQLHWMYIPPAKVTWAIMQDSAKKINTMDFGDLAKLGSINKQKYDQFWHFLGACADFKCDRTGKSFGPIDNLTNRQAFFVDSLSGLSIMAMDLVVGSKPVKALGDWGVAMDNLERLINNFCTNLNCFFAMTAHIERETDEISGATFTMPSTLGRKLAPKIPRYFSDVVHCKRKEGTHFVWSTITPQMDLKARNLPWADDIKPSFTEIVKRWKARQDTGAAIASGNSNITQEKING